MKFEMNLITPNLINITNRFSLTNLNKDLFKPSNIYYCCAVVNGKITLCTRAFLTANNFFTTTTSLQTQTVTVPTEINQTNIISTTKTTEILTNGSTSDPKTTQNNNFTSSHQFTTPFVTTQTQNTSILTNNTIQTKSTTSATVLDPKTLLEIEIENIDGQESVVIKTDKEIYVSMISITRRIKVTCRKLMSQDGEIVLTLNNILASKSNCNSYKLNSDIADYFCLSKTFEYDLTKFVTNEDFFSITCFNENDRNIKLEKNLYKLCKFLQG